MSDFGLTEDMYSTNYHRRGKREGSEEKVPIRWMPPESIENDLYNESTDVVSYIQHNIQEEVTLYIHVHTFLCRGIKGVASTII